MELSTDWIEDFEIEDKDYKQFYKEPVKAIQVYYLYVNRHQELFHIKKQKIDIQLWERHQQYLEEFLKKAINEGMEERIDETGLRRRIARRLKTFRSPEYRENLQGCLGVDPSLFR